MNRRTLLRRIVATFSAITVVGVSFPFLKSWLPDFDQTFSLDIDLEDLDVGEAKTVRWLGRNVYIVRREPGALVTAAQLQDPESARSSQPEFAKNELRARKPDHLVVFANCTHLGCEVEKLGDSGFEGFSCPCHQSEFDRSGRVKNGSAAKLNLEVPDYEYIGRQVIRLRQVS